MPFAILRNDIVKMRVDAVVNAANSALAPGGGVCGAIFAAAGYAELDRACSAIGHCSVGSAVITSGFHLPAKYIIHAVGPIWQGGGNHEAALLSSCYTSSLQLAEETGCRSIAFPLISSGIYGYPKEEALRIAVEAISAFLQEHEMQVYLVVFDRLAVVLSEARFSGVQSYIDDHYVDARTFQRREAENQYHARQLEEQEKGETLGAPGAFWEKAAQKPAAARPETKARRPLGPAHRDDSPASVPAPSQFSPPSSKRSLKDLVGCLEESFSAMLLRLIDEKGMTDVEVYKRANMDRKLFSKLRKEGHNPSKPTAIALAVALRLNLDETRDLLGRAGYTLSHSSKFDVIIEYFISEGVYDIYEINEALFAFDQRLLG